MEPDRAGFCLNSRQWIDFWVVWNLTTCPYEGHCENCDYYQLRQKTAYYKRIESIIGINHDTQSKG